MKLFLLCPLLALLLQCDPPDIQQAKSKPVVEIAARDLAALYSDHGSDDQEAVYGRRVLVRGSVIGKEKTMGSWHLYLEGNEKYKVSCDASEQSGHINNLSEDDRVTVSGVNLGPGFLASKSSIVIDDCVIE